jgi:hypothetical protein
VEDRIDNAIHALAKVFKQKLQEENQRIDDLEAGIAALKQVLCPHHICHRHYLQTAILCAEVMAVRAIKGPSVVAKSMETTRLP